MTYIEASGHYSAHFLKYVNIYGIKYEIVESGIKYEIVVIVLQLAKSFCQLEQSTNN